MTMDGGTEIYTLLPDGASELFQTIGQNFHGQASDVAAINVDGGQGRVGGFRHVDVVETGDRQVVRHLQGGFGMDILQGPGRRLVVETDECGEVSFAGHDFAHGFVAAFACVIACTHHQVPVGIYAARGHGIAYAAQAILGRSIAGAGDNGKGLMAQFEQVLGDQGGRSTVVHRDGIHRVVNQRVIHQQGGDA